MIDVTKRKPKLVMTQAAKTMTTFTDSQRFSFIEAVTVYVAHNYGFFDGIVREDFTDARSKRARQGVFGAWAAVDLGLGRYGSAVTAMVSPTAVKKTVTGDGKADKAAVADGVRKILRLPTSHEFRTDDESDACAIILTWLISEGLIDT